MAGSVFNARLFSALVFYGFSTAVIRRGYAAASEGALASAARVEGTRSGAAIMKKTREEMIGSAAKVVWVPDPVTGCYKPQNRLQEIDVAELRAVLLNRNKEC